MPLLLVLFATSSMPHLNCRPEWRAAQRGLDGAVAGMEVLTITLSSMTGITKV